MPDTEMEELSNVAGLKDEAAHVVLSTVKHIRIPLEAAKEVFYTSTLTRYALLHPECIPGC